MSPSLKKEDNIRFLSIFGFAAYGLQYGPTKPCLRGQACGDRLQVFLERGGFQFAFAMPEAA